MTDKSSLKVLIIGFGSIGQRHYKNLLSLGYENVFVYDVDPKKIHDSRFTIQDLNEKTLKDFNVAFITNPTHLHVETALLAAKAGCNLFIEKPLSHNLKGIKKLEKTVEKNKLISMVAANMRFHPALSFIKKYLEEEKLGKIYRISHEFGHFLPYWRPGADYKVGYAMKKETGGGILLDDIHEYDLLFWLLDFKDPIESHIIKNKTGNITEDSEDQATAIFLFPGGIIGTVTSDYLSQTYRRGLVIIGEKGNITWSLKENIVWLETKNGKKEIFGNKEYDLGEMYLREIEYFLDCVLKRKETENSISRAARLLNQMNIK